MMKSLMWGLGVGIVLGLASGASAYLTDGKCAADGDNAIVMETVSFSVGDGTEGTLGMSGTQYEIPAHVTGDFITDTEEDPSVTFSESVVNDTSIPWTGYKFYIYMNKSFTISSPTGPNGWTYNVIQPTTDGHTFPHDLGTGWVGLVEYSMGGGSPIGFNEAGDFGMRVSFAGGVRFCTEQIPVPEPASLLMLTLGGLGLVRRAWQPNAVH